MNHIEVRNIIKATLNRGDKTPGLFDLPKLLGVKSKLESCTSIDDVVSLLEGHRSLISKSFGISDVAYNESVVKISALNESA